PPQNAEDGNGSQSVVEHRLQPEAQAAGDVPAAEGVPKTLSSGPVATPNKEPEGMSVDEGSSRGAVAKRAREESVDEGLNTSAALPDEPPPKAAPVRRASLKPKPNIPLERRPPATSPP
ncbi:unnamed protein product, partial [Ixodes hexagonus]